MGRGLSDLQRDILKLADMRRQQKNLEPVRFSVYLTRDAPEKFTEIYASRMMEVYRRFVPERKTDLYFNPELRVRTVTDVALHMKDVYMGENDFDDILAKEEEWKVDLLRAAIKGRSVGDDDVMRFAVSLSMAAAVKFSTEIEKAGLTPLSNEHCFPSPDGNRLSFKFKYGDYDTYTEAKTVQEKITAVLTIGRSFVSYVLPQEWHVSINEIMADCCGLRQYALTDGELNGGRAFDHSLIDPKRYNVIRANVTRACQRLEDRHLVVRTGGDRETYQSAAIAITTAGVAVQRDSQ
jgi:hypothetical protein